MIVKLYTSEKKLSNNEILAVMNGNKNLKYTFPETNTLFFPGEISSSRDVGLVTIFD